MMNANNGYVGWSMSRRAVAAYEDGEKPRSKWTKKAMIAAIKDACDDLDLAYDPAIEKMKKDELFHTFLYNSSWHHTGKFFNETDFYAIDEDALADRFPELSDEQLEEREARRAAERKATEEERAEREAMRAAEIERLDRHIAYQEEHGFDAETVAAFAHEHPECCEERINRKGNRVLSYIDRLGHEQVCPIKCIHKTHLRGFDATESGSFGSAVETYLHRRAGESIPKTETFEACDRQQPVLPEGPTGGEEERAL